MGSVTSTSKQENNNITVEVNGNRITIDIYGERPKFGGFVLGRNCNNSGVKIRCVFVLDKNGDYKPENVAPEKYPEFSKLFKNLKNGHNFSLYVGLGEHAYVVSDKEITIAKDTENDIVDVIGKICQDVNTWPIDLKTSFPVIDATKK